jgi:DNA polymerase IV (DinB-like DNA polymerase)
MRIVGHLDMDAFFAAIEERDNPSLYGLPIVIGADPHGRKGRGLVVTANYKAREYGIHWGLPISTAWQLSEAAKKQGKPSATFLPVRMARYAEVSAHVMEIIRLFALSVEQADIDEAYFDLSSCESYVVAEDIARKLKGAIREEERLTASLGIGPNKLIAKIASRICKPDGLTVVREEDAMTFLAPLPVRTIPGIGAKIEAELVRIGVKTIKDIRSFSQEELRGMFGKRGVDLYEKVRGKDESPIEETHEVKSIGEQETFEQNSRDPNFLAERLKVLCRDVVGRVTVEGFTHFHRVVVTVRFEDLETKSRSHTLPVPMNSLDVLQLEAMKLLVPFLDDRENP